MEKLLHPVELENVSYFRNTFKFQKKIKKLTFLTATLMLMFFSFTASASHFRFGSVTATRLSETATTVTYQFRVSISSRNDFVISNAFFNITGGNSGSFNVPLTTVVDPSGLWTNGTGNITYTLNKSNTPTRVSFNSSAKVSTTINNHDVAWDVYTILNTNKPGSTPVSTLPAIINMPINAAAATYTVPASDPDAGASLTFGTPNFVSGTLAGQTEPSGFSLDPITGQIKLNTIGKTVGQLYNALVTVTDNDGNQILLDFIIQMVGPSNPPVFDYSVTPANGTIFNVIAGQNLSFPVKASDTDAGSTVSLSASGLPSYITSSNFSPAFPATGNPSLTNFSYTPSSAQSGTTIVLNFIATDNVGVQSSTSITIRVVAEPAPVFDASTPLQNQIIQIPTGIAYQQNFYATSPIGSNVSFAFKTGFPASAVFSPAIPTTGTNPGFTQLNWTPVPSEFGLKNVSLTAQVANNPGIFSVRNFSYIVNTSPVFTSTPSVTEVLFNTPFTYNITISDLDIPYGDVVDVESLGLPSWLTLTSTGNGTATLSGTPSITDGGTYHIKLEAADTYHHGNPTAVLQEFDLKVTVCNTELSSTTVKTSCPSSTDGSIDLSVSGGKAPFTFAWSNGATTEDLLGLAAGNYSVTVTDANNCTATSTITVQATPDLIAPVVPILADVTGECSATAPVPTALDNCSGTITGITTDATSYSTQGTHVITWTFTDAVGNFSTATQNVVVKDVTAPVKPVLADVTGECSATAAIPTTTDNCAGIITGTTTDALTYTTQGTHVITWTFNDGNGNSTTATQNVVVKDVTAPVKPVLANVTGECSATATVPTTTDNCAGTVIGTTTDALTYSAQGNYVVTWTFNDGNGNITTATQNVIVKDVTAPVKPVLVDVKGQCSATVTAPTTTDNCAGTITGTTTDALTYTTQGTYVITWSFNDGNGNISKATQNVIVKDDTKPVVLTQNRTIVLSGGSASITAALINNGSSDNCGIGTMTLDRTTFDCGSIGTNTVTLTVTDIHGNPASATATVTVVGELTSSSIASVPTSTTYTGGVSTNLYLGYGAQSTTLQVSNMVVGGNGTNPKTYTYAWSGSAVSQLSSTTSGAPVFTPTSAGYYTFNVLVTNKYGCTSAATISICVKDIREVTVDKKGVKSYTGKVYICHAPPGNVGNSNTLSISVNAVESHLSQHSYDRLGSCSEAPCSGTSVSMSTNSVNNDGTLLKNLTLTVEPSKLIAYPNPFNHNTTVSFKVPYAESNATLDIYDVRGVRIQNLFKGSANANQDYEVKFDGSNIAAGTYFLRLSTSKEVKDFKVVMTN